MADGSRPRIRVVSAEIVREGRYLITQRRTEASLAGLWEFPGGRVHPGESDSDALCRCLADRIGCVPKVGAVAMEVVHEYEGYTLVLAVYSCDLGLRDPLARRVAQVAWVAPDDFGAYPFPGADQKTVDLLLDEAGEVDDA